MHIFVDESGTFTQSDELNSWCVVAAYVVPEYRRRNIEALLKKVKLFNKGAETKLKHLSEDQYMWFLRELAKLDGLTFAVAVDVGLHRRERIEYHRDMQAAKVVEHQDKMIYESGRQALTDLSEQISTLPAQLYTQLVCQIVLFQQIIASSTLYFAQRHPAALANFRWQLDQKAQVPTQYEEAFHKILPALLQTGSFKEPMISLKEADYSHFSRYVYQPGQVPSYLKETYGIEVSSGVNIGKIVRDNFQLVNSADTPGVQVADLLASGIRRLLRNGFVKNDQIARLLGANFVQSMNNETVVKLISLDRSANTDDEVAKILSIIGGAAKPMLA